MKKSKPDLQIDSNERGGLCDSVTRKAENEGLTVVRTTLVVGDYLLGEACVEAKSIGDLLMSSHSGHLWRQLENMDANYARFFLVVHGSISKHVALARRNGAKVTYSRVQNEVIGTIARIMADFDCQVFFTESKSEAASFIIKLHDKLHKPASAHGARGIRRVSTNDVRLDMILTVPGIGREMGERILEHCGSLNEMTFIESLQGIKGLGPTLRERIVFVLTSENPVHVERKMRR